MTCIVALRDGDTVWMGGDSAAVAGWSLDLTADPKVFASGAYLFGYTTSFRMGQLLQFGWEPPACTSGDVAAFMRTTFIDAVRARFAAGGFTKVENAREEGGVFLVAVAGDIYKVQSDFQVLRSQRPFAAVGCGADVALGSLATSQDMNPEHRVTRALEVAEMLDAGVRRPFTVLHQEPAP